MGALDRAQLLRGSRAPVPCVAQYQSPSGTLHCYIHGSYSPFISTARYENLGPCHLQCPAVLRSAFPGLRQTAFLQTRMVTYGIGMCDFVTIVVREMLSHQRHQRRLLLPHGPCISRNVLCRSTGIEERRHLVLFSILDLPATNSIKTAHSAPRISLTVIALLYDVSSGAVIGGTALANRLDSRPDMAVMHP